MISGRVNIWNPQGVGYLTTDEFGSNSIITDQNGAVVSRKDFAAFGDEVVSPQRTPGLGYQGGNVRQDYTGYEKDDESGWILRRHGNFGHSGMDILLVAT